MNAIMAGHRQRSAARLQRGTKHLRWIKPHLGLSRFFEIAIKLTAELPNSTLSVRDRKLNFGQPAFQHFDFLRWSPPFVNRPQQKDQRVTALLQVRQVTLLVPKSDDVSRICLKRRPQADHHLCTQRSVVLSGRLSQFVLQIGRQPQVGLDVICGHLLIIKQSACTRYSSLLHSTKQSATTGETMARGEAQTNVRLPLELKDWLAKQAETQRRSLTNEIILRLEESRARQGAAQQPTK